MTDEHPCWSCGKFGCRCLEEHAKWAREYKNEDNWQRGDPEREER
jgi:hypothetical protein